MRTPIHAGVAAFLVFAIAALPISAAKKSAAPKPADFRKLQIAVNGLLEWKVGLPGNASGTLTLFETADKALAAELGFIEGYSTQKVSAEIAKNLDSNLSPEELTSIKSKLDGIKIKMPAYHVESLGTDETSDRKTFEFAKALGVETIVTAADPAGFAAIDKLANEFNINVAVAGHSDPKSLMTALEPHSSHLGVDADLALWMQQGSKPVDALSMVGRRLFVVELSDQSAVGKKGHPVVLGTGAGDIRGFLLAMSRVRRPDSLVSPSHCGDCSRALVGFKPVFLAIGRDATSPEALSQTVVAFEKAVQPAMGDFVGESSRAIAITSPDLVPTEGRQKIEAALPREAFAKPK